MTQRVVTDAQWAIIDPHFFGRVADPGQTGRDPGLVVEAILWFVRTRAQRHELLIEFGKLKENRGIAMRSCKTDKSVIAIISIAAAIRLASQDESPGV